MPVARRAFVMMLNYWTDDGLAPELTGSTELTNVFWQMRIRR